MSSFPIGKMALSTGQRDDERLWKKESIISEVERSQAGRLDHPLLQTPGGLSDEDTLNDKEGFMSVYLENSSSSSEGKGN